MDEIIINADFGGELKLHYCIVCGVVVATAYGIFPTTCRVCGGTYFSKMDIEPTGDQSQ